MSRTIDADGHVHDDLGRYTENGGVAAGYDLGPLPAAVTDGAAEGVAVDRTEMVLDPTIAGTSRLSSMVKRYSLREVPTKPPVLDMTDTPGEALTKWRNYTLSNGEFDLDAFAAERGWAPIDPADEARIRADLRTRLPKSAIGFDAIYGTYLPEKKYDPAGADFVFITTAPKAEETHWAHRSRPETYGLIKPAVHDANANVIADVDEFMVERHGIEADQGVLRDMLAGRKHWTGLGPEFEDVFDGKPIEGVPYAMGGKLSLVGGQAVLTASDARRAWDAKRLVLCGDPQRLADHLGIDNDPEAEVPNMWVDEGVSIAPRTGRTWTHQRMFHANPDEASGATTLGRTKNARPMTFAEFTERTTKHHRARMTEVAVAEFAVERMELADDAYLEAKQRVAQKKSATVWEDKKHIPDTHREAATRSVFAAQGVGSVEIDERVDLDDLAKVEKEWDALSRRVPHTKAPNRMAFRLTGRHRAAGVYSPALDAIAVDPRHPSSMWHEYVHHLDHTTGDGQISHSDDFRPILRQAQQNVSDTAKTDPLAFAGKDIDYYRTPTEVFSRAAEAWMHWSGVRTSLNGDADKYDGNAAYTTLEPMREQIMEFFDAKFGPLDPS